jgi:NAD(P)-dependent dehydrogenase (short-subunit alcohol dehydrogenase family)
VTTERRLAGKTIVITGAGRGLGLAMTSACLADGASVIAVDRDASRLQAAADELRSLPAYTVSESTASCTVSESTESASTARLSTAVCDIVDEAQVAALFEGLTEAPWGVVNNAALADGVGGEPFWEIESADWRRVLGVNLDGTWLFSKYAARSMIEAGKGRIVNMASDAALYGSPRLSHYIASKGGIIALTRAMARDAGPHGITVNAIAPGLTEGPSAETIPAARHQLYADGRALARTQVPDDICGLATFLLGDDSSYITGQTIVVDGGFVMP